MIFVVVIFTLVVVTLLSSTVFSWLSSYVALYTSVSTLLLGLYQLSKEIKKVEFSAVAIGLEHQDKRIIAIHFSIVNRGILLCVLKISI